jgi:hypothetical protein
VARWERGLHDVSLLRQALSHGEFSTGMRTLHSSRSSLPCPILSSFGATCVLSVMRKTMHAILSALEPWTCTSRAQSCRWSCICCPAIAQERERRHLNKLRKHFRSWLCFRVVCRCKHQSQPSLKKLQGELCIMDARCLENLRCTAHLHRSCSASASLARVSAWLQAIS